MSLLIPLYLGHQGYPIAAIGLLTGLAGAATLLSRVPVPLVYRPERAVPLLLVLSLVSAAATLALPYLPDLVWFAGALFVGRAAAGAVTAIYLARFLDMMGEGTNRRKTMGWYGGTQAVGYTASNLVAGLLADFLGYVAAFGFGAAAAGVVAVLLLGASTPLGQRSPRPSAAVVARPRGLRGWLHGVADPGLWGVLNVSTWNNVFHVTQTSFLPVLGLVVGLSPGQIGVVRAVYSGINAVGRPVAGMVMSRFSLRQINYLGMAIQAALACALPFMGAFGPFVVYSLVAGLGRAVVVVASSAGLAEEVDETRVTRGVSTAAYSTTTDLPATVAPLVGGGIAAVVGVAAMFPLTAVGTLACFIGGDLAVARWRARRAAAASGAPHDVGAWTDTPSLENAPKPERAG